MIKLLNTRIIIIIICAGGNIMLLIIFDSQSRAPERGWYWCCCLSNLLPTYRVTAVSLAHTISWQPLVDYLPRESTISCIEWDQQLALCESPQWWNVMLPHYLPGGCQVKTVLSGAFSEECMKRPLMKVNTSWLKQTDDVLFTGTVPVYVL